MLPLSLVALLAGTQAVVGAHPQHTSSHTELARRAKQAQANPHRNAVAAIRYSRRSDATASTAIWWEDTNWIGACGTSVDELMVGLPLSAYPDPSTKSSLCGQKVRLTSASGSVTLTVGDASSRSAYTTISQQSFIALGGDTNTGELAITFSVMSAGTSSSASISTVTTSATLSLSASESAVTAAQSRPDSATAAIISDSTSSAYSSPAARSRSSSHRHAGSRPDWSSTASFKWIKSTRPRRSSTPPPATASAPAATSATSQRLAQTTNKTTHTTTSTTPTSTPAKTSASSGGDDAGSGGGAKITSTDSVTYTGAAATVAWSLLNANLASVTTSAASGSATQGILYSGSLTWYSASEGGYGSCGVPLYDGAMDVPFVALSLFDWMGAPGPSPHCFDCVQIFNKADPSKTQTAIVADSCQVCTFGHVDAEQALFTKLGGGTSGPFEVGWSFVDCPAGYSKEGLSKVTAADYVAIDVSLG